MTSRSRKSTIEQSEVILKTDDRRRVFQVPPRDLDEAPGGEREVPEDAEHVTMAPEHVPMQMRTDDESNSEDE